jgi:fermentation-respiration switch protein FrsA (DUF1100 family)
MNQIRRTHYALAAALLALATLLFPAHAQSLPALAGKWHGALQTATGTLSLELTVDQDAQGGLHASLESVDQAPGQAIPVASVRVEDKQLKLDIEAIAAGYEGQYDAASDTWRGTWLQGPGLPLTWKRGPLPALASVTGLDGVWRATLNRGGKDLRLVLRLATTARGTSARLDSPDMGIAGMNVTGLTREGTHVRFDVPLASTVFSGTLADNDLELSGIWRRDGMPQVRVTFSRPATAPAVASRPQTPRAPFDYLVREVEFANAAAGISLAGTLTVPRGPGPFPAAVLITGSGPQDRDETLFGHKPFAVLADHLARKGIAVLRVDDRGVGKSGGNFASATNGDFAGDALAALHYLAAQPGIDRKAIGMIGHSQGGIVGPIAAQRDPGVAWLVLLAAPATSMSELLIAQRRMAGVMQGRSEAQLRVGEPALAALYGAAEKSRDRTAAKNAVKELLTPERLGQLGLAESDKDAIAGEMSSDWLLDVLQYDAAATLASLRIPLLALNGSLDQQVPARANLAAIRRAATASTDVTALELAGLNHLFQPARSGAIAEYAEIELTFAPSALSAIGDWIDARFGHAARAAASR